VNRDHLKSFDIYTCPRVPSLDLDTERAREIFEYKGEMSL